MILSQTATYALRAMLHLAEADPGVPVRVDDIAEALKVPRNYLSKILHGLTRAGLLDSTRGPKGGFVLSRPPDTITLAEAIGPFDDIASHSGCLLGRDRCSDANPCPAHTVWRDVSTRLRAFLNENTLASLPAGRVEDVVGDEA